MSISPLNDFDKRKAIVATIFIGINSPMACNGNYSSPLVEHFAGLLDHCVPFALSREELDLIVEHLESLSQIGFG